MRRTLTAITEELKRLKAEGVDAVTVTPESLAGLQRAVRARAQTQAVPATDQSAAADEPPASAPREKQTPEDAPADPAPRNLPAPPAVALPLGDKQTRWNALLDMVRNDAVCRSQLRPDKQVVLGVGNLDARIMFVGEAPGAEEEVQGEPFVGPAGQLLTRMIAAMGLSREEVYIGNIMNWRPQMPVNAEGVQFGNRPPNAEEMAYCLPFLRAQIEIVDPALIVALGATAAHGLLGAGTFRALGEVRGAWKDFAGKPLMITYHPSYILRNQSNRSKRMIWEDLLKVMERAGLPINDKQRGFFLGR